ncbi:MAG: hypothetical protein LBU27_03795 [Candidatus Peribacteria bacterium]|nr:hypothetical protein [Candidatus Peribacteria bacterium]
MAILSATDTTPRKASNGTTICNMTLATSDVVCSYHYSNKIFTDTTMIAGDASMPAKD